MFPNVLSSWLGSSSRLDVKPSSRNNVPEKDETDSRVVIRTSFLRAKLVKSLELKKDDLSYRSGGTPETFIGILGSTKILPENFEVDVKALHDALFKLVPERLDKEHRETSDKAFQSDRANSVAQQTYDNALFYCLPDKPVTPETRSKLIDKLKEVEENAEKAQSVSKQHQKIFETIDAAVKNSKLPPGEQLNDILSSVKMTKEEYEKFLSSARSNSNRLYYIGITREALLETKRLIEKCLELPEAQRCAKQKSELAGYKEQAALLKKTMEADAVVARQKKTEWLDERGKMSTLANKLLGRTNKLTDEEFKQVKPILEAILEKMPRPATLEAYEALIKSVGNGDIASTRLARNAPTNQWPERFVVAAATSQRHFAWGHQYVDKIFEELPRTKHLPSAIWSVEENNAMVHTTETISKKKGLAYQVPVSTRSSVNVWDFGMKAKRHVLYIQGDDYETPGRFTYEENLDQSNKAYDRFEAQIKEHYGQDVTFTRLTKTTEKDIEKAIDDLQKSTGKDDEILVVLSGHGSAGSLEPGVSEKDRLKEGALIGSFWLAGEGKDKRDLSETFLKQQMQKLKDRRGIILIDACYSGAWISQAPVEKSPGDSSNG